jgi:hypothetical protein
LTKDASESGCIVSEKKGKVLFKGEFVISQKSGEIEKFGYSAPMVEEQFQSILRAVRDHPEWSDEQAGQELRRARARFGPWNKPAFVKEVPLKQLEPFFGKLHEQSVQFRVRAENGVTENGNPDSEMLWEVRLSPVGAPERRVAYYWLLFEPLGGKLVSLGIKAR